ncbi:hypothetical protein BBJ28_00024802 [Nothophytophthora sp. Chile5]|nr:hypothetical protein BBJ28_00024802 [Nothophytophthora sp. Chile5]
MPEQRNSIPFWRKQEVITWIIEKGDNVPYRAIKHFQDLVFRVDGGTTHKWRNREEIMSAKPHQHRLSGGGRKPLSTNMEYMLYDQVINKRLRKEKISRQWIADVAVTNNASLHADDDPPPPFTASTHWLSNFMARYSLSQTPPKQFDYSDQ